MLQISRLSTQERKADTRNKIQLGGLVVKAGLGEQDKALILGILVDAFEKMSNNPTLKNYYLKKGETIFNQN